MVYWLSMSFIYNIYELCVHILALGNVQLLILRRMSQVSVTNMNIYFLSMKALLPISKFDKPIIIAEI